MKINFIKRIWVALKASILLEKAFDLAAKGNNEKALAILIQLRPALYNKDWEYHFELSRQFVNANSDNKSSLKVLKDGITLLEKNKLNQKKDNFNYLMSWANYSMGLDLFELNKKDEAEKLRTQSESCIFDIKKVSNRIKDDFPMPWHIDYQKSEKGR